MKTNEMSVSTTLSKKDLKDLLSETKETLAIDTKFDGHNRTFGMVDLWNIQKRQRTSPSMRRRLM